MTYIFFLLNIYISDGSHNRPRVILNPTSVNTDESRPVEVQCQSSGSQPLQYIWERIDGGQLSRDVDINQGILRFYAIQKSDEGDYRCSARNSYGDDSQILHVFVRSQYQPPQPPPSRPQIVEITPPNFSGRPGDEVRLNCRNQPQIGTLIWTKEGIQSLPFNIYVNSGVLIITSARIEDSGKYTCTSSTPDVYGRPITSTANVYINDNDVLPHPGAQQAPTIKRFNELYTVIQGHDFSLICEVAGSPHPTVKWTRVHEEFNANTQQNGNILRILNANPENRGVYTCIAENSAGNVEESTVIDIERKYKNCFFSFAYKD